MERRNSFKFFSLAFFSLISLLMVGCGSNSYAPAVPNGTPNVVKGALVVFGKDAPVCDVVSFTVTITGATLTPQGGGTPVPIILASPITVDFARLVEFSTVLNLASVPVGTYSQATLTLSNPQLSVLDVTQSPPVVVKVVPTTLTDTTVTFNIAPALNVTANGSAGLEIEFNLRKSVQVDSNGQVTGSVKPTFKASPSSESNQNPDSMKEIDDLAGLVQSVATTNSNNAFTGSLTLLTEDLTTLTVNTTSKTEFDNATDLSGLATGTFVEAHVFVDSNGNIVAREIEAEEQEDENQKKSAFAGLISSVTRDSSGNATQFTMFIRGEMPDQGNLAPIKSTLTVNLSSSTLFKLNAKGDNKASLSFNAGAIGPGQEVVVHGKLRDAASPPTVDAVSVHLRLQSIMGNFVTLLGKQSDNKTGGFTLVSCAAVFGGQPINIFTSGQTAFAGISDLTGLTPQPTIVVRGLLFYEQNAATVNGIAVTPPTMVFEATAVHQLSD